MRIVHALGLVVLFALLAACGTSSEAVPTLDESLIYTQAAQTVAAQFTQTSAALTAAAPTMTNTPPPTPTMTLTFTPEITTASFTAFPLFTLPPLIGQATPTFSLLPAPATPTGPLCDNLTYLADIGTPDNTVLKPGDPFAKGWLVQNTGACDWIVGYHLVRVGGNTDFGGALWAIRLPNQVVQAGAIAEISLNLFAPNKPGLYEARYQMYTHLDVPFGMALTVAIEVQK